MNTGGILMFNFTRVLSMVSGVCLLAVLVLGISCNNGPEVSLVVPEDPGVSVDIREDEVSSLPGLSEGVSQFLAELEKQDYEEVEGPEAPMLFRWDFSGEEVYEYEVNSRQKMRNYSDNAESDQEQEEMMGGDLVIRSLGDRTAEFVLKNIKSNMKGDLETEDTPDDPEQIMTPMVIQGIIEDGSGLVGNNFMGWFLQDLFPLPETELSVGESADIPMQTPLVTMTTVLMVNGRARITLARYVKIGDRTCAELEVDIDISELDVPEESDGEYYFSVKGESLLYFDIDKRCFLAGTMVDVMEYSIDELIPKFNWDEDAPKVYERSKISMWSDSLTQVTLKDN